MVPTDRSHEPPSSEQPTVDDRPGRPSDQQLKGLVDYELAEVLGAGGMGEVVQARDLRIGRDVAIKRMRDEAPSAEKVERFLREAKIQARLDHPAIVPVYELGFDAKGQPFFTMKRLSGVTLEAAIESRSISLQRQLRALAEVCNAIDFAHARGVVHRDLKPSNIMLGDFGEVYVIDWGVARVLGTRESAPVIEEPDPSGKTVTGQMLGTPGYMAPEQITGESDLGPPADVYALGAILFEILAGEPLHPHGGAALITTVEGKDTSPAARAPGREIPIELDEACRAALERDPARRATVRQLRTMLEQFLDGDRDLERRREQARELAARAATADRIPALQLAGRALALDPGCEPAIGLLARLLIDPPRELAPELVAELRQEETAAARQRSRRAVVPYVVVLGLLLASTLLGDVDTPMLLVVTLAFAALTATAFVNWRVRAVPGWAMFGVQLIALVMFTQITGIFLVVPALALGMLLSLTSHPSLIDRRWAIAAWAAAATLLPMALEKLGLFRATWWFTDGGLVTRGTVFPVSEAGFWALSMGNSVAILMVAMYALALARDRRTAQRHLYIQAWQLRQLVPH